MKTKSEIEIEIAYLQEQLKAFDEPKFNFGDRVIAWDEDRQQYKGIYDFYHPTSGQHYIILDDKTRSMSLFSHCKLDPDIQTLVFKRHDGSEQPAYLAGKEFYYKSSKIGFGKSIGRATNGTLGFWKTVVWYALEPECLK